VPQEDQVVKANEVNAVWLDQKVLLDVQETQVPKDPKETMANLLRLTAQSVLQADQVAKDPKDRQAHQVQMVNQVPKVHQATSVMPVTQVQMVNQVLRDLVVLKAQQVHLAVAIIVHLHEPRQDIKNLFSF
jgi:hypothetical protein